jgi:hypothetical protein
MMIELDTIDETSWPESLKPQIKATKQRVEVSVAATQLRKLRCDAKARRRQRVYTGRVGRRRAWRGMKVILPDGHIGELLLARRGAALVRWRDEFSISPDKMGGCRTDELRPFKLPSAVLLGSRKKGVVEKPSERKAMAVRLNGSCPPRPGSRPRGRPRSIKVSELAGSTPASIQPNQ